MREPEGGAAPRCEYGAWSAPERVPGLAPGEFVRDPSLAVGPGETYVLGNDISVLDSTPIPSPPLIVLTLDGKRIAPPPGDFLFKIPRAVVDGEGTLHVMWAEGDTAEALRLLSVDLAHPGGVWRRVYNKIPERSLWYAAYRPGRGWSAPERAYRGPYLTWSFTDGLRLNIDGRLHTSVMSLGDPSDPGGMFHLERNPDGWRVTRMEDARAAYSSVALGANGRAYLAIVGINGSERTGANSIFLARSDDAGATWGPVTLVSPSRDNQTTNPRVVVTADGAVHLVYGKNLSGGLRAQVLRHQVSRDGGVTWSEPEDANLPDGFNNLRVEQDRCGAIHVIATVWSGDEAGDVWYARWSGGWSTPKQLFPELNALEADLALTPDGVLVFWSARPIEITTRDAIRDLFQPHVTRLPIHVVPGAKK